MTLITHLRDHAVQAGQTQKLAGLAHGLRERLLHVNVFTQHDRHVGRQEMHVVRRRDADGIGNLLELQGMAEEQADVGGFGDDEVRVDDELAD